MKYKLGFSINEILGRKVEQIRSYVTEAVAMTLAEDNKIAGFKDLRVASRWENMPLRVKAKWWLYRKVLKRKRLSIIRGIDQQNEAMFQEYHEQGMDWEDQPATIEYPDYCLPDPKSLLDVDVKIQPIQSIEWISVDVEL